MEIAYKPYVDPQVESLIEELHPPRVCIDNDSSQHYTLVKVDSANKHGILLEMVQVLTDLDLVISKSYISSDGGWLMDVFHVTDQVGKKITDQRLIHYIQEAICASRKESRKVKLCIGREMRPRHVLTEQTALEMTGIDRPGLLSEISAVLAELGCHITAAVAWTHKQRTACIIYVEDQPEGGPITDPCRVAHVQAQLENVIEAHHYEGERRSVRLAAPTKSRTHTERRLHQLMAADKDFEGHCSCCDGNVGDDDSNRKSKVYPEIPSFQTHGTSETYGCNKYENRQRQKGCDGTFVHVGNCKEKGYYVVTVRSRDRPKLLFDTVCALTDMEYVVYHAAINSTGSIATQEYYVRHKDRCTLDTEREKQFSQCLIAATERRISHGLRLDVSTENRKGLLSDVTRVFRENGLSIKRAEIGTSGDRAIGTFFVTDASGENVSPRTLEMVRKEIGGTIQVVVHKSMDWASQTNPPTTTRSNNDRSGSGTGGIEEQPAKLSLGSLLWSQLGRLSSNFKPIRS